MFFGNASLKMFSLFELLTKNILCHHLVESSYVLFVQKISKLKSRLHMLDVADKPANKHKIFVDSKKEGR